MSPTRGRGPRPSRVRRTGIALVHEGETVAPAAGSEALAEPVDEETRDIVHYHFPVEVEVRAAPEPIDVEELVEETLTRLIRALKST